MKGVGVRGLRRRLCAVAVMVGMTLGPAVVASAAAASETGGTALAAAAGVVSLPRSVTASTSQGLLRVAWQPPKVGTVTGYTIACTSTDGAPDLSRTVDGTTTSVQLDGLPDNTTYRCSVVATGPAGTSVAGWSGYVEHAQTTSTAHLAVMHLPTAVGQRVHGRIMSSSLFGCGTGVALIGPRGAVLTSACPDASRSVALEGPAARTGGTALLRMHTRDGNPGSAELLAYVVKDLTGGLQVDGPAKTLRLTTPGQAARIHLDGTAGTELAVRVTSNTITGATLRVLDANAEPLASTTLTGPDGAVTTAQLPVTGRYLLVVDPDDLLTGQLTVTVTTVPANTDAIGLGQPTHLDLSVPGQSATRTFPGHQGQQIAVAIRASTLPQLVGVRLADAQDSAVEQRYVQGPDVFLDPVTLPADGTYTLTIDPQGNTGSLDVELTDVPRNTGTLTLDAAPALIDLPVPGETGVRTFTGTEGQHVTLTYSGSTLSPLPAPATATLTSTCPTATRSAAPASTPTPATSTR